MSGEHAGLGMARTWDPKWLFVTPTVSPGEALGSFHSRVTATIQLHVSEGAAWGCADRMPPAPPASHGFPGAVVWSPGRTPVCAVAPLGIVQEMNRHMCVLGRYQCPGAAVTQDHGQGGLRTTEICLSPFRGPQGRLAGPCSPRRLCGGGGDPSCLFQLLMVASPLHSLPPSARGLSSAFTFSFPLDTETLQGLCGPVNRLFPSLPQLEECEAPFCCVTKHYKPRGLTQPGFMISCHSVLAGRLCGRPSWPGWGRVIRDGLTPISGPRQGRLGCRR